MLTTLYNSISNLEFESHSKYKGNTGDAVTFNTPSLFHVEHALFSVADDCEEIKLPQVGDTFIFTSYCMRTCS